MSFFKLPLWLLGLNSSTGTDKLLAVKDNGEVTQSSKTLDEIGLTPTLQDVLAEDNNAVTEGNWQFGNNRSRVTSNNGFYAQDSNFQTNYKKNGVVFREVSTGNSTEFNFSGSSGTNVQQIQDASGTIALTSDITTPNLQDVTTEGNTTTKAIQVFNNVTANNFISATGQAQAKILKAQGDLPVIQINDTDVGGANIELRPHAGTYNIDLTTPIEDGQIALNSTSETKTITGTGDKLILSNQSTGSQAILFDTSETDWRIEVEKLPLPVSEMYIKYGNTKLIRFSSGLVDIQDDLSVSGNIQVNGFDTLQARTINSSTPQTTALLDASFPSAISGFRVVNLDSTQRYIYTKCGSVWRQSALMTDI